MTLNFAYSSTGERGRDLRFRLRINHLGCGTIVPVFMRAFAAMGFWLIALVLYLLPWLIAAARSHRNALAIFFLNLLLGWTFLGWVVALVWSVYRGPESDLTEIDREKNPKKMKSGWHSMSGRDNF